MVLFNQVNASLLATKFFAPPPRAKAVQRAELRQRLSEGLILDAGFSRRLTLVSAPPGFGKTSLVSEWLASLPARVAWLALDEKDSDPARFVAYLVSALQTAEPGLGAWVLDALQVPQPPSLETLLTRLLNDLSGSGERLVLALDDYHAVTSPPVDGILAFLIDNLPARVHLALATREDPGLPLARYRARGQMAEFRAKDLRFSYEEVGDFLRRVMGISLTESDVAALETRTEGWAAGLQFAALAIQGNREKSGQAEFIASFTGSHRFVLDYLVEEVLLQRTEAVQEFLLATSCLERFCGPLCDAILEAPAGRGRETLESLDRANLFLIPLDGERRWYRYHHLFAELLRQRLGISLSTSCPGPPLIHSRASAWFERNDFIVEAFRHAAASGDSARTEALIEDRRMPTHTRGAMLEVLGWLTALPDAVKNASPSLWVKSATIALAAGQVTGVEERLLAAESALLGREGGERLLLGQIATARATLAISQYRMDDARNHGRRALELLAGFDTTFLMAALWDLGIAELFAGDRAEARRILEEVLSRSRASGAVYFQILSALGIGELQENDNQLPQAAETFSHALGLSGEHPQPNTCVAHLGLARIHYEWNKLDEAANYAEQGLVLAHQYDVAIDRFEVSLEVFLARLETVKGNLGSARERLDRAERIALENGFRHRIPEIRAAQALLRLRMGSEAETEGLGPQLRVRILLGMGRAEEATELLDSWSAQAEGRADERLRGLVLRAILQEARGNREAALDALEGALALAEPGGFLRLFVDEGPAMRGLVREARERGEFPEYADRILAAFPDVPRGSAKDVDAETTRGSVGFLSDREREVLLLLADGLSNQDIGGKLFISPHTVKVHVRNIFEKLGAQSRGSAVAKARSLGLLR